MSRPLRARRFRRLIIDFAAVCTLVFAVPEFASAEDAARWPDWMPKGALDQVNKGDDAGGTSLLLEPNTDTIVTNLGRDLRSAARSAMGEKKIRYEGLRFEGRGLSVVVADKDARGPALEAIGRAAAQWKLRPDGPAVWLPAEIADDGRISVRLNEAMLPELREMALAFQLDRLPRLLKCLGHERFSVSREGERIRVIVEDATRITIRRPGPCSEI